MTITITCPTCKRRYDKIKPEYAGKKVRCSCGRMIRLVEGGELTDAGIDEVISEQPRRAAASSNGDKPVPRKSESIRPLRPAHPKGVIDVHYSDLDDILRKPPAPDNQFDPRLPIRRPSTAMKASRPIEATDFRQPTAGKANNAKTDGDHSHQARSTRHGFSFLLAIISASLAFWFSVFLIVVRFSGIRGSWIQLFSRTFSSIYSGQVGVDEMLPGLKSGLAGAGWIILVLAILFALLAIIQFANAGIVLLARKTLFRWSDGLLASVAIGLIFVMIGTVFLHSRHISSLKRKIEPTVSAEANDMTTITALKKDLSNREKSFIGAIAISAMIPLCVFVCSMIRLFIHIDRTDEKTLAT